MSALHVDLDLVKKYNVAGPRYTSYPPATKFTDSFSRDDLDTRIEENNRSARDLSVYFHIPFCETLCWFCGCTTVITLNHDKGAGYIDYLGREVAKMSSRLNPKPICVRSFVPNEKNSAVLAIRSAVRQARGISIIVP